MPAPISTLLPRVGWRLPVSFAGAAQSDTVVDGAVVPDLTGLTEHDAHAVINEQASADGGTGVDLDAGAAAAMLADPPGQKEPLVLV